MMPGPDPIRVLLVDDTDDIRLLLRMALDLAGGFDVVGEAGDGLEGARLAEMHRPDVVVLDLAMPVMDGLQAGREIRRRCPSTRIVVMSGFSARRMGAEAAAAGADAYVEKGGAFRELPQLMRQLCRGESAPGPPMGEPRAPPEQAEAWDFLSFVAHELLTPVTVIEGLTEVLMDALERLSPDATRQAADAVRRNTRNLSDLVRGFAEARCIEMRSVVLHPAPSELGTLVRHVVSDLRPLTEPHPVEVTVLHEVRADVDPVRIRQVLTNLLANAAKYSPPEAPIAVFVRRAGTVAEVSVEDGGPGIPPEDREAVFEKFTRLSGSVAGTGLGLYIARGIARAHGGELLLSPGNGGSRFTLCLPLDRGEPLT